MLEHHHNRRQVAESAQVDEMFRKELKRLEHQVQELLETNERTEARAKKAEDRARAMEERGDRSEEALRSTVDQVRREVMGRVGDLQKKQHEDGSAIQSLQMDQAQTSQLTSRLQEDLRKEGTARAALEASARSSADTAEHALRVAEETRQSLEDTVKQRLEILELKVSKTSIESLKKLSVPERIMYFQNAQRQSGSSVLKDESPNRKGESSAQANWATVAAVVSGAGTKASGPLLRCVA